VISTIPSAVFQGEYVFVFRLILIATHRQTPFVNAMVGQGCLNFWVMMPRCLVKGVMPGASTMGVFTFTTSGSNAGSPGGPTRMPLSISGTPEERGSGLFPYPA